MDKYNRANGYPHDADVIYGDTDSVRRTWRQHCRHGTLQASAFLAWTAAPGTAPGTATCG